MTAAQTPHEAALDALDIDREKHKRGVDALVRRNEQADSTFAHATTCAINSTGHRGPCTCGGTPSAAQDRCSCCGREREYDDSNYWYCRKPRWFWRLAYRIVCPLLGCRLNCDYADCYRCG